jgi:hypothetical protein
MKSYKIFFIRHTFLNALHHHADIWKPDLFFIKHGTFKVSPED